MSSLWARPLPKGVADTSMKNISITDRLLQRTLMRIRPAFVAAWIKKILRVRRCDVETQFGTFHIDPVSQFAASLLSAEGFEPAMRRTLALFLKQSSVFVDIGANEGFFSIIGSRLVGESGKVIAVEPQSRLKAVIEKNLQLNGVSNVSLFQCAISNGDGTADLFISPSTNTGSSALNKSTRYGLPREAVSTTTFSGIFAAAGIGVADFVKMDIEGFEYEVIADSAEFLKSHRIKALGLEMHPVQIAARGLDPSDMTHVLESAGYVQAQGLPTNVWVVADARQQAAAPVKDF
jgi:FkbM family methyltransferase